jgi:uncharacterized protein
MKKTTFTLTLLFILTLSSCWQNTKSTKVESYFNKFEILKYKKPINSGIGDFENIFSDKQKNELDSIIKAFNENTTNQIAIVTIDSLGQYKSIMEFTTDLGNYWGVGLKEKDNGLIITFSKRLRKVWIGTGYGTEKILNDVFLSHLIDSLMIPNFKQGKYFEGIKSGMFGCMDKWTK